MQLRKYRRNSDNCQSHKKKNVYSLVLLPSCNTKFHKSNGFWGGCCTVTCIVEHLGNNVYLYFYFVYEKKKYCFSVFSFWSCSESAGLFLYFNHAAIAWEVTFPSFLVNVKHKIPDTEWEWKTEKPWEEW